MGRRVSIFHDRSASTRPIVVQGGQVTTFCAVLRTAAPGTHAPDRLVSACGRVIPMPIERWWAPPSAGEREVLDDARSAALDVGCGPARHVLDLVARGVLAVGLDSSDEAVRAARSRGARVVHGSIFDRVPAAGEWGTALLFDGNIGIGGDPASLLERVHQVLRPGGRVLVEVAPPGVTSASLMVRASSQAGPVGDWFPWAQVSAADLDRLSTEAGFELASLREIEGRWYGRLERP
jgi:SAM-dependent methyltransferase